MSTETPAITPDDLLAHTGWLQRLAARLVEPSGADDLVQETWVAALRSPPTRDRPLRPWLAQVLRNLVRNRARGAGRWAARAPRIAAADDAPLPTAEQLLTYHEAQRLVAELVAGLAEPFRSTVLLCYAQGLAPNDVARRLGIPAGTVRWRLKRGLDELRSQLDARYGHDRRAWTAALAPLTVAALRAGATAPTLGVGALKLATVAAAASALALWLAPGGRPDRAPAGRVAAPTAAAPLSGAAPPPGRPSAPSTTPAAPGGAPPPPATPSPSAAALAAVPAATQAPPAAGPAAEALRRALDVGDAPTKGEPKAPVTIVTFAEFQCPFSARAQATLRELLAAYPKEVRLVFKNLPLAFHEHAQLAAEAALAAQAQGKFWPMHDRLFANQDKLDPAALEAHAQALGLDVARFRRALDEQTFRKAVEEEARVAKEANITGTPSFFVNGEPLVGAQPLAAFKRAVDEALARGKGLPASPRPAPGLPRSPSSPLDPALAKRLQEPGGAPTKGEPKAPVTMVVFSEFQCPFCARVQPTLGELQALFPKELRLVFRNLPLAFHEHAQLAAEAALAAHEQGKFWPMHDRLFANQDKLAPAALEAHAQALGLDVGRWKAAMDGRRFRAAVEADAAMAREAGFAGTPTFVVNGRVVAGAQPLERFKAVVERELARAKGLPVPPEAPEPVRTAPGGGVRRDLGAGEWPPPRFALPDELLGERVKVPFPIADAPRLGPSKAPVEILYLNDYDLIGAERGKVIVDGLRRTYRDLVEIVALPVPSTPPREPNGPLVAEAAWAAHEQGKFWQMHDKLFTLHAPRDRALLERYAREIGLDVEDFKAALDGERHRARVAEDLERAQQAGLRRRPTFVVNGRRADGTTALVLLVEAALKKAGHTPPPLPPAGIRAATRGGALAGLPLGQRFHATARDEAFDGAIEKELAPLVARDLRALDPDVSAVKVDCRSGVCRISWRPGKEGGAALPQFVRAVYRGERRDPAGAEDAAYLALREPIGAGAPPSAAEAAARLRSRRAAILYSLRTGRTQEPGLPTDRLPKE